MIVQATTDSITRFRIHLFSAKAAEAFVVELSKREGVYELSQEKAWVRFFTTGSAKAPALWAQEFEKSFTKRLADERLAKVKPIEAPIDPPVEASIEVSVESVVEVPVEEATIE